MEIEKIQSKLWSMADNLRGTMDASEYKNYILAFMFYRYLSEAQERYLIDEELVTVKSDESVNEAYAREADADNIEDYKEELTSGLGYCILPADTWASLTDKIENSKVIPSDYQDMFDHFNESTKANPNAHADFNGIFNDVNLGDSRLGNNTTERAKALNNIVDLVNSIEYKGEDGADVLGQIYEYLIGMFAASAGKKGGEFYTPHMVSKIMAKIVTDGKETTTEPFEVYDPTCGSGSLLLTVGHCLEGSDKIGAIKYYGQEMNTTTYNLARMNLMMHEVRYQDMHLSNADTLGPDWPNGKDIKGNDDPKTTFTAVVSNPPYSAKWDNSADKMKDPRFKEYGKLAPKTKADYSFLLHGLYHLDNNGTMAIVLPHGVLFRGAAEETIRKVLIEKNRIDTVIGLPANLFYGTSIPTIIMILKKASKKDKSILFIDASNYFTKNKNKNVLTDEDVDRIVEAYRDRKDIDKFAHLATLEEIRDNDYNLNIPRYVDTSEEEEEIDIHEVLKKIEETKKEEARLEAEINEQLKILGVLK